MAAWLGGNTASVILELILIRVVHLLGKACHLLLSQLHLLVVCYSLSLSSYFLFNHRRGLLLLRTWLALSSRNILPHINELPIILLIRIKTLSCHLRLSSSGLQTWLISLLYTQCILNLLGVRIQTLSDSRLVRMRLLLLSIILLRSSMLFNIRILTSVSTLNLLLTWSVHLDLTTRSHCYRHFSLLG